MKPERTVCSKLGPDLPRDFNSQITKWNGTCIDIQKPALAIRYILFCK